MEIVGFFLAALVGVSLGLIGGGGSILTVPILVYLIGINPVLATSYSLFIVGTTSLIGAYMNYKKGYVNINTALLFGLSSITTVFITRKFLLPHIPHILFSNEHFTITQSMATMVLFAILMLSASIAMIRSTKEIKPDNKTKEAGNSRRTLLVLNGIFIGLATGLLGAGGGFLIIPALIFILKMPMKEAVGTSLLIIALNSLIGFTGDLGHFTIDWKLLIFITLISIAGIFIGGYIAKKIEGDKLKKVFGWFVLNMGVYILIKEIFFVKG